MGSGCHLSKQLMQGTKEPPHTTRYAMSLCSIRPFAVVQLRGSRACKLAPGKSQDKWRQDQQTVGEIGSEASAVSAAGVKEWPAPCAGAESEAGTSTIVGVTLLLSA